jgi:hypothetical protein
LDTLIFYTSACMLSHTLHEFWFHRSLNWLYQLYSCIWANIKMTNEMNMSVMDCVSYCNIISMIIILFIYIYMVCKLGSFQIRYLGLLSVVLRTILPYHSCEGISKGSIALLFDTKYLYSTILWVAESSICVYIYIYVLLKQVLVCLFCCFIFLCFV